jgi:hypothetical protein
MVDIQIFSISITIFLATFFAQKSLCFKHSFYKLFVTLQIKLAFLPRVIEFTIKLKVHILFVDKNMDFSEKEELW